MNQTAQLDHLNISVNNLEESFDWYKRVFGFNVVEQGIWDGQPWGIIRSGDTMLCMYENAQKRMPDFDNSEDMKMHHLKHFGLRIGNPGRWQETIKAEGMKFYYPSPCRYPHSTSWYIKDPTGHRIEVVDWDEDNVKFG